MGDCIIPRKGDVRTVIFVLLFNAVWGVVAALWFEAVAETGASG